MVDVLVTLVLVILIIAAGVGITVEARHRREIAREAEIKRAVEQAREYKRKQYEREVEDWERDSGLQ